MYVHIGGKVMDEKAQSEESFFISLCGKRDKAILTGKEKMTLYELERFLFIVRKLELYDYEFYLSEKYYELFKRIVEQVDRQFDILSDYPEYIRDEEIFERQESWLMNFYEQLPPRKKKKYRNKLLIR